MKVIPLFIIVFSSISLTSCTTLEKLDKALTQRAINQMEQQKEENRKWNVWFNKYIKSVLYIGMPEDEFIRLFTKNSSWNEPERPYIIRYKDSSYIIIGPSGTKHRITFLNGTLYKFETLGYEKIPIIGSTSWDYTFLLKGYRISEDLYIGMSEDEFLQNFSSSILLKFKNGGYVIVTKDGKKYGIEFTDGVLTHFWSTN
jgi:hypothetical protein